MKKIIKWLGVTNFKPVTIFRNYLGKSLDRYLASKGKVIYPNKDVLMYDLISGIDRDNEEGMRLVKQIKKESDMLFRDHEAYLLYRIVGKVEKIKGDIAEVGTYRGGSAKLIRQVTNKTFYLFDTFEGLPESGEGDTPGQFKKGEYSASLEAVKDYLKDCPDMYFYKGVFPATSKPIEDKTFSFVHLDVDLYEPMLDCLKFFYPRMVKGGVILAHDYSTAIGVKKAFEEFFEDKPEIVIQLYSTTQCLVIKV